MPATSGRALSAPRPMRRRAASSCATSSRTITAAGSRTRRCSTGSRSPSSPKPPQRSGRRAGTGSRSRATTPGTLPRGCAASPARDARLPPRNKPGTTPPAKRSTGSKKNGATRTTCPTRSPSGSTGCRWSSKPSPTGRKSTTPPTFRAPVPSSASRTMAICASSAAMSVPKTMCRQTLRRARQPAASSPIPTRRPAPGRTRSSSRSATRRRMLRRQMKMTVLSLCQTVSSWSCQVAQRTLELTATRSRAIPRSPPSPSCTRSVSRPSITTAPSPASTSAGTAPASPASRRG